MNVCTAFANGTVLSARQFITVYAMNAFLCILAELIRWLTVWWFCASKDFMRCLQIREKLAAKRLVGPNSGKVSVFLHVGLYYQLRLPNKLFSGFCCLRKRYIHDCPQCLKLVWLVIISYIGLSSLPLLQTSFPLLQTSYNNFRPFFLMYASYQVDCI